MKLNKTEVLRNDDGGVVDGGGGGVSTPEPTPEGSVPDSGSSTTMMSTPSPEGTQSHDTNPPAPADAKPVHKLDLHATFDQDGKFNKNWSSQLGDDFIDHAPTLDRFTSVQDLAKSYMEAKKTLSGKPLSYPSEGATDEQKEAWNKQAMVAENPEKFIEQRWGDNKEGLESFKNTTGITDEALETILDQSIKSGVPAPALQEQLAIFEKVSGQIREQHEAEHARNMEEANKSLRSDFGDQVDSKIQSSIHALDKVASIAGIDSDTLTGLKQDPNFGGNPHVVRLFAAVADSISDAAYKGHNLGSDSANTFRSPMDEAQDIMNNSSNPLYDKFIKGDKDVNAKVDRLIAKSYNNK